MVVWWLLVVIGWKHRVMDHDGVGFRPRVMEQVLTMNVIPYNESHKTDLLPSASFVRSPNCRDGTSLAHKRVSALQSSWGWIATKKQKTDQSLYDQRKKSSRKDSKTLVEGKKCVKTFLVTNSEFCNVKSAMFSVKIKTFQVYHI